MANKVDDDVLSAISLYWQREMKKNKKPSWCWDSQPSVGILGIFF